MRVLSDTDFRDIFYTLQQEGKVSDAMYVYSFDLLKERLLHLQSVFPSDVLHAVAIKTNNLPEVLKYITERGFGLEAASFEEVELAIAANCLPTKIVFDGPVKTSEELKICNEKFQGLRVNANSFHELDKLQGLDNLDVGIRINPMLDISAPDMFMVSGQGSKFGIPITYKEEIIAAVKENKNIRGLHVHPGSEISKLSEHVDCISVVHQLAKEINSQLGKRIFWLDIGGGVKAEVTEAGQQKSIQQFADGVTKACPGIFEDFAVITEYGRFVHSFCAFAISKVEDILTYQNPAVALIHLGADLFVREVYSAIAPSHSIHNLSSTNKTLESYDLGGPLCFTGDFLKRNIQIVKLQIGDYIAIGECGSNTISMWSQHCSRTKPDIIYVK